MLPAHMLLSRQRISDSKAQDGWQRTREALASPTVLNRQQHIMQFIAASSPDHQAARCSLLPTSNTGKHGPRMPASALSTLQMQRVCHALWHTPYQHCTAAAVIWHIITCSTSDNAGLRCPYWLSATGQDMHGQPTSLVWQAHAIPGRVTASTAWRSMAPALLAPIPSQQPEPAPPAEQAHLIADAGHQAHHTIMQHSHPFPSACSGSDKLT